MHLDKMQEGNTSTRDLPGREVPSRGREAELAQMRGRGSGRLVASHERLSMASQRSLRSPQGISFP